jgi:hypothetical protein
MTAIVLWGLLYRFFDKPVPAQQHVAVQG